MTKYFKDNLNLYYEKKTNYKKIISDLFKSSLISNLSGLLGTIIIIIGVIK